MIQNEKLLHMRLSTMESIAKVGMVPGELDRYELEQLIGRIKELKFILEEDNAPQLD